MAHQAAMSASSIIAQKADSPTLKRAFAPLNCSFPSSKLEYTFAHFTTQPSTLPQSQHWHSPELALPSTTRQPSMVTSARTFTPMPSFGAVFGGDLRHAELDHPSQRDNTHVHGSNVARPASSGNTTNGGPFSSFHIHHDSRDSNSTASSDNSPTTTISTMDGSSVTDPSPGPSPESPLAKTAASSSFAADFRARRTESHSGDPSPSNFFELQRPTTPAKKPRNLKNLGINTTTSLTNLRSHVPAPAVVPNKEKNNSAPPSPLFIKPPTPPRRRPSNLSLTIASPPGSTDNKPIRLLIPSTPALNRPGLRHFQSSPSLPICSPSVAPTGGMQLPSLRTFRTNTSGLSEVPFEMEEEEDLEPNFDIPQSREEKPAAYPNGPICIYEAGAATFDLIINVASEVKNPFTILSRVDGPPAESKPVSFERESSSPTTPKATSVLPTMQPGELVLNGKKYRTPEYIHMPWEHNTDIVPDLYRLVKIIDDRVQKGKRVLIHCQCGVSRSASLVVAYGLYKDPQKRSKWIGPNMNLIMQLQEFRNGLLRANDNRSYHNQSFGRRSVGLPTIRSLGGTSGYASFEREAASGSRTPQTAPLPPDGDIYLQRASTGNMLAISPGPLSAPTGAFASGFRRSWDSSQTHFNAASLPTESTPNTPACVEPEHHGDPVLSMTNNDRSAAQVSATSVGEVTQPDDEDETLRLSSVPNFSRQLPFRQQEDPDEAIAHHSVQTLSAPVQPPSYGALRSPAVSSFSLASLAPRGQPVEPEMMSPVKTSFDVDPWTRDYNQEPQPPSSNAGESQWPPSPRATFLDFNHSIQPQSASLDARSTDTFVLASPTVASFPKDIFGHTDDLSDDDLRSPRATEFHMTPLKPRGADTDPFGLTSPSRSDFMSHPFERPSLASSQDATSEARHPSFQAIMPPSHQTFSGFASLDGTAQTQPMIHAPVPTLTFGTRQSLVGSPYAQATDSFGSLMSGMETPVKESERPQTPKEVFLATPAKTIRTRFSSPNMSQQRELQKLQTNIQSRLPQHAADDIDALMSPRAEEFTKNPFHLDDLHSSDDDSSPASSNETIKGEQTENTRILPQQWILGKAAVDPRSPVQTGSNPIVRNIWDVL
ncbi:hypothetical protein P153DRAFT_378594 [Dothidotthia symphoricarpi CBS 119687]|uniref:protein-tyrosine-phosphatase n=1 Tax=Dothidotthia symphoricarpi CBS 119687 TaxID=1392245 RepID=A0A6A6A1R7_9PLEO|nr:uncharacterized protein P153DRAFT_378594 [Dothidotthia symphoricarpi CBS 119687]KAF2125760.1 hypothetical protein P153DRAFT_378594 [Dothidotthia symphoricarpi CBS 119687]